MEQALTELERATQKRKYWHDAWKEATERELQQGLRANDYRKKLARLEAAVRELMDETDIEDEGKLSRELRKHVWNQSDSDALIEAEGVLV